MLCPIHFNLSDAKDAWLLSVEPDLLAQWRPTSFFCPPALELVVLAIAESVNQDGQPMVKYWSTKLYSG